MDFWDDLSKKLSDAADYTVRETGKLTEIAKLKYRLSVLRGKENDLLRELGKIKYGECGGKETDASACGSIVEQIRELRTEAEDISNRLAVLRNYKFCIACHEKMAASMTFCPYCGTKQEPVDTDGKAEDASAETETDASREETAEKEAGHDAEEETHL